MDTTTPIPDWVKELSKALSNTIQFRVKARMQGRFIPAADESTDIDFLELTPIRIKDATSRSNGDAQTGGVIHIIDITNAEEAFDAIFTVQFGYHKDGYPDFVFQGMKDDHDILVHLRIDPLDDAEVVE